MRSVLALALTLVLFALGARLLRHERDVPGALAHPGGSLAVLAAAKGSLLPAGTVPGGVETMSSAILIGDSILRFEENRAGLRAAWVDAALELRGHERFQLAEADGRRACATFLDGLPLGSTLVLASTGAFAAAPEDVAGLLANLGARSSARELASASVSWAWIGRRSRGGWVALAEGVSTESGVVLAWVLHADGAGAGGASDFVRVEARGRVEVALEDELDCADRTEDVVRVDGAPVGGVRLPAIFVPPRPKQGGHRSVVWDQVPLGSEPRFTGAIGLRDGAWAQSDGARFELWVDATSVHTETLDPRAPPRSWLPWNVDLAPFAARKVRIELRVEPLGHGSADLALWGKPLLVYRAD